MSNNNQEDNKSSQNLLKIKFNSILPKNNSTYRAFNAIKTNEKSKISYNNDYIDEQHMIRKNLLEELSE